MLDEISYREQLWGHKPLSDFWRIGSRTERKLAGYGIQTMGDIALASIQSEDWLYKMFGIDAELLIDHAWGCESCKMSDIKNYHTEEHSLSNGQVLMRNYTFEEAAVVVREMTDVLVLDLVEKGLVTNSVTLWIAYDHRFEREPSKGTVRFPDRTNRSKEMIDTVEALYRKIADPHTGIRRIEIIANKITPEGYQQYTLFQDSIKAEKERHLQEAVLQVKKRYGKNAIMRGSICWNVLPIGKEIIRLGTSCVGGESMLAKAYQKYLYIPRPVSKRYPMDVQHRAKQFAPLQHFEDLRRSFETGNTL